MQKFIIKSTVGKNDFYMTEGTEFVYFFCKGLKDLRDTIRAITPKGYRVRTHQWLSKHMKLRNNHMVAQSLFRTTMHEIKRVDAKPVVSKTIPFTNSFNFTHTLKLTTSEHWKE